MQEQKRSRPIKREFYINKNEDNIIKSKMKEHNLKNFSTYARKMLLEGEVKVINFDELRQFRYEVKRIGTNINQIAKQVNIDDEVDREQLRDILELLKEVNRNMNKRLKEEEEEVMKE